MRKSVACVLGCLMIAWAGLSQTCRAAEAPEDSQQEAKLAKLPEGKSILPADNLKTFSIKHGQDVLRMEIVPVESMPFREALRIEKLKSADDDVEEQGQEMDAVPARVDKLKGLVQIETRSVIPLRSGDWVLLTFYARTSRRQPGPSPWFTRRRQRGNKTPCPDGTS